MVLIELGDIVLGMDLVVGGYLIYGVLVSFLGKIYYFVFYFVDFKMEMLDYDNILKIV